MRADRVRRYLPGTVAVAGVVAAHAADYAVLYPDPAVRDRALLANGHGYWPGAVLVAAVLGAVALAVAAGRGSQGRRTPLPSLARLAATQALLFTAVEIAERVGSGVSPLPFLRSPAFAVGLALQVVVAAVALLVLSWVERAAGRVAALLRGRRPRPAKATSWALPVDEVVEAWWHGTVAARGPPASLRA